MHVTIRTENKTIYLSLRMVATVQVQATKPQGIEHFRPPPILKRIARVRLLTSCLATLVARTGAVV